MGYQRGALRKVHRKAGETWMLRYRVTRPDGRRVENTQPVGLVRDFPKEKDAWREVDRLHLLVLINDDSDGVRIRFDALAEHYLKADFGADAVRPKSENTKTIREHIVRDYLVVRWGSEIAEDITSLDIQRWPKSLHTDSGLAWTTIAKMRGVMSRNYKVGLLHGRLKTNPAQHVETRSKTNYRAIVLTPAQTFGILKSLTNILHHALVRLWLAPRLMFEHHRVALFSRAASQSCNRRLTLLQYGGYCTLDPVKHLRPHGALVCFHPT